MKHKSEIRFCKKCHKELPISYQHSYCEACRNRQVQTTKKTFKTVGSAALLLVPVVTKMLRGGK